MEAGRKAGLSEAGVIMVVSGPELWGIERVRMALFEAGYKVAAVDVEKQPLGEAISRQKPALFIANLSGEPANDLELCQRLGRLGHAPIVAIGSSSDDAFRVDLLSAGADDYLVRPVNPRELVARVRNILRRTQPFLTRIPVDGAVKGAVQQGNLTAKRAFLPRYFRAWFSKFFKRNEP